MKRFIDGTLTLDGEVGGQEKNLLVYRTSIKFFFFGTNRQSNIKFHKKQSSISSIIHINLHIKIYRN